MRERHRRAIERLAAVDPAERTLVPTLAPRTVLEDATRRADAATTHAASHRHKPRRLVFAAAAAVSVLAIVAGIETTAHAGGGSPRPAGEFALVGPVSLRVPAPGPAVSATGPRLRPGRAHASHPPDGGSATAAPPVAAAQQPLAPASLPGAEPGQPAPVARVPSGGSTMPLPRGSKPSSSAAGGAGAPTAAPAPLPPVRRPTGAHHKHRPAARHRPRSAHRVKTGS